MKTLKRVARMPLWRVLGYAAVGAALYLSYVVPALQWLERAL